uniref:Dirigent protein n=1 Tax=Leersia perrieri TaxID=77586 RepID=A0A0D9XQC3_9ORYZ
MASLLLGSGFLLLAAAVFLHHHHNSATTTTTHLHFYMHDAYTGPSPTAIRVVSGATRSQLLNDDGAPPPREFGDIVVLNNALTEGPSATSARVGTAQGFAVRVSERGVVSDLSLHMVLDAGEHKGSSVTAKGRIDMDAVERESVVIGGTGHFRFARGYMVTKNYDYSLATGGVVEIDLYLQH